jgi:diguanylate cyclase (GGDEF)-like protein/PAS domain S-box-containing protein
MAEFMLAFALAQLLRVAVPALSRQREPSARCLGRHHAYRAAGRSTSMSVRYNNDYKIIANQTEMTKYSQVSVHQGLNHPHISGDPEPRDGTHIVIVDDSTANLKLYAKIAAGLEPNVHVHSFNDPRMALEWLDDNPADLVISDYKMPTMHGAEFTRHIRRVPTCPDVPVVVVTAYADHNFRVEALEAGASDFLLSPVDYLEFQTRARNLVRLGRHQRLMRDHALTLEHELKESEKSRDELLRHSRERLAQVIDTVPAMISATDTEGNCIFVNAYQGSVLGATARRPNGSPDLDLQVLASGKALDGFEETLTDESGGSRTFLTVKSPLRDADGKMVGVLTTSLDITERKRAEARLVYQAQHDHLTSLPNRAHLYDQLRRELEARRVGGQVFALHFIDLDRFKYVNDGLGHHLGDRLLQEVGQRLQAAVRDGDAVARLGGDEFAILQSTAEGPADAAQLANRINQLLLDPFIIDDREVTTSASIGVTLYPKDGQTSEELLQNADLAMYRVKAGRRNGFAFFADEMLAQAREAIRLQSSLRRALEAGEFVLHYQPLIDLRSGMAVGAEALIRWQSRHKGLMMPASFLRVAEDSGLMQKIDQWVLHEACQQAKTWLETLANPVRVSVNVSPLRHSTHAFFDMVMHELDKTGLPPALLGIELTEEILLQQTHSAAQDIEDLHQHGVQISIDDFGTGYSSLARLTSLHVDKLKIDRSFVTDLEDSNNVAIIRAVVSLGHALNMEVLAEGVETADQVEQVRLAGCDSTQGYYTGYPMDARQFEAFLRAGAAVDLTRPADRPSHQQPGRRQLAEVEAGEPAAMQPR